jgi:hypothetical protein
MFKNEMRFFVFLALLSVVRSFTMCKPERRFTLHADTSILEQKNGCKLLALKEWKCQAKHRPIMRMNHVSEPPIVTVNIPSSDIISGIGTLKCNVSVRVAIDAQDVDAVAVLRCRYEKF